MIRSLILAVAMLWPASALAQFGIWIPTGDDTGIGIVLTSDGKVVTFNKLMIVKSDPTNPPPIPVKAAAVTYVYEKDNNAVPAGVARALQAINEAGSAVATDVDDDVTDGDEQVPDQYKVAFAKAKEAGVPCLVVQKLDGTVKVVKDPKTEAQVMEALR